MNKRVISIRLLGEMVSMFQEQYGAMMLAFTTSLVILAHMYSILAMLVHMYSKNNLQKETFLLLSPIPGNNIHIALVMSGMFYDAYVRSLH